MRNISSTKQQSLISRFKELKTMLKLSTIFAPTAKAILATPDDTFEPSLDMSLATFSATNL